MCDRRNVFDFNHISSELNEEQITELKEYYQTYHRKCWAFKQATKRFKKWKLLGDVHKRIRQNTFAGAFRYFRYCRLFFFNYSCHFLTCVNVFKPVYN